MTASRGVRLADGTTVGADVVVVAAGPWSPPLLAPLGIDLPVTAHRETLLLVAPGTDVSGVPVLSDLVSLQYVRSEPNGDLLVGNSDLSVPTPADPDRYSDRADPAFLETAVAKVAHRFPGLPRAAVSGTYAGCYDVTPDLNPVVSRTPVAGLVVAAGFSGHGFKISPAVGALVADLVVDGDSRDPLVAAADLRLARFAEGAPLVSPHPYATAAGIR